MPSWGLGLKTIFIPLFVLAISTSSSANDARLGAEVASDCDAYSEPMQRECDYFAERFKGIKCPVSEKDYNDQSNAKYRKSWAAIAWRTAAFKKIEYSAKEDMCLGYCLLKNGCTGEQKWEFYLRLGAPK